LLAGAAWIALSASGPGVWSHPHGAGGHGGAVSFLSFFTSWTIMTVAMMLPTSLPVLATLHTFASRRADRWLLVSLATAGYLGTWAVFGMIAYIGVALCSWLYAIFSLQAYASAGPPLLLLVAGGFQFTSLKYRCLEKCRSPFSVVLAHWQGHHERLQCLRLGVSHGIYCVGCCWALMLLMFALGAASLVWMLVIAIVMATEKNLPWGRRLRVPLGVILLAWGATLLVVLGINIS
jgi:predicted metal-binding membrane protein